MKISELTYERVRQDLASPAICTGCDAWSANWHYRGIRSGGTVHWSRQGMRRSGLHAFVRAVLCFDISYRGTYAASVMADEVILSRYGIRIPASASKRERRYVLSWRGLRTEAPHIYAWATYKGAK
jgi:hypothetical protein